MPNDDVHSILISYHIQKLTQYGSKNIEPVYKTLEDNTEENFCEFGLGKDLFHPTYKA